MGNEQFDGRLMRTNKNNKPCTKYTTRRQGLIGALVVCLTSFSHFCSSQDLVSGNELKDSSLSLSLMKHVVPANNQASHMVISQYGILNNIEVSQMANLNNTITVLQNGMNNSANLSQQGYGNVINLEQFGNDNFAEVIQDGNANTANIIQTGEQNFTVHQIGSDMVVNITQY